MQRLLCLLPFIQNNSMRYNNISAKPKITTNGKSIHIFIANLVLTHFAARNARAKATGRELESNQANKTYMLDRCAILFNPFQSLSQRTSRSMQILSDFCKSNLTMSRTNDRGKKITRIRSGKA